MYTQKCTPAFLFTKMFRAFLAFTLPVNASKRSAVCMKYLGVHKSAYSISMMQDCQPFEINAGFSEP
jgi:hypothetical protein